MKSKELKEYIRKELLKEGYKEFLTTNEEHTLCKICRLNDTLEEFIKEFNDKNNLTPIENKSFKTAYTLIKKGLVNIIKRIDQESFKRLSKKNENLVLVALDEAGEKALRKKVQNTLKMEEEVNEKYLDLCCEIMHINCKGCKQAPGSCELAKNFIKNEVVEPTQENFIGKKCRYAYKLD